MLSKYIKKIADIYQKSVLLTIWDPLTELYNKGRVSTIYKILTRSVNFLNDYSTYFQKRKMKPKRIQGLNSKEM